jgi:hypothetical protein
MALTGYASTLDLSKFMRINMQVPDLTIVGAAREREEVGTGDNTTLVFWLDHAFVIADSYSILYGASDAVAVALTETTHYILDKDLGKITLTVAGRTAVGTNKIYASYSYVKVSITDTQLQESLNQAETKVDELTNNHFADGTDTTPNWKQILDEVQDGQGVYNRNYFTLQNYPIPNVSTTLDGDVAIDDAIITVASTNGFPSSGYIFIGSDKIQYTGKTSVTFTGCTSVEAHSDGETVKPYGFEISTTSPGGSIDWTVMSEGTGYELDKKTGRVHVYADGMYDSGTYIDVDTAAPKGVASRFRGSYLSGNSTIPATIKQVTLMIAAKDIMSSMVRTAHAEGLNDFNPALIEVDDAETEKILNHYRNHQFSRV